MKLILHRSKKWLAMVAILTLSSFLLYGCWDSRELEKRATVAAMAVDKSPQGYELSVQVPSPRKTTGGGGGGGGDGGGVGGDGAVEIFSGEGRSFHEAMQQIESKVNFPLFIGHMQLLLISDEVAREGIFPLLDGLRRSLEIRRHLWPVVILGKAKDALKVQVPLEEIPIEYLRTLIGSGIDNGRFAWLGMGEVSENLSDPVRQSPILNAFSVTEKRFIWEGIAILRHDRLIGLVQHPLVTPLLQIRKQMVGWPMAISCPKKKGRIIFVPRNIVRTIDISEKPQIDVTVKVEGEIAVKECYSFQMDHPRKYELINHLLEKEYEKAAKMLVDKAQKDFRTDIFTFGKHIHAYYPRLFRQIDWMHNHNQIPVRVRYEVEVRRVGLESG
ncbi:Ger(x)C family spore germination protein [Thermoactinomyces mirandus]|uniref:Ger(X)C family spore germination protein n=1 Tax=Thermoactinomyces mirandus TaxID=2756294 RepID=A0A7W1XSG0_9BACL|nr:Ger(x)C family spore germination protein [Thermoactinomyces mirandus]MBA4602394.1 Ger(x)C family spore germination protein [Thermoactinomyces mirandus]